MIKNIKWLFLGALTLVACSKDEEVLNPDSSNGEPLTAGSANFSKYVALGDSFAAGFSDGALFIEGQKTSYPSIIAQQFATVGGGAFRVPFMADNIGGFAGSTTYNPRLYYTGIPASPIGVVTGPSTTVITDKLTGAFNNMGIPGAKVGDLDFAGYGSAVGNPYFARFASTPIATAVDDAIAQNPTFFTLFIGGNDVLAYAAAGGTGVAPTPPTTFDTKYNGLITKLTAGGRKGAVANLPYVNALPYFTTVPTNAVPGLPATDATQLNQLFGAINQICAATNQPPRFQTLVADDGNPATTEANPLLISDESLALDLGSYITTALSGTLGLPTATFLGGLYGKARHASKAPATRDYIVLPASAVIGTQAPGVPAPFNVVGVSYPMQDNATVTAFEANEIKVATDGYNATIQAAATSKGLAFFDAKTVMNQLSTTGITGDGYLLTTTFVSGGAFSLDGIHPSPRGYALLANYFIDAINKQYGSNIKGVKLSDYRILFPKVL